MDIFHALCKLPSDKSTWTDEDHVRLARVMYIANIIDQPNDGPDGKHVAEFVRTGVLPKLHCFFDKDSSLVVIRYLSIVWKNVELDERTLDLLMGVANMPL